MQRRARDALERATLATPPAPNASEITLSTRHQALSAQSPTPAPHRTSPLPPAPTHVDIDSSQAHPQRDQWPPPAAISPQQATAATYTVPVVPQHDATPCEALQQHLGVVPTPPPAAHVASEPPGSHLQPIIIPPPSISEAYTASSWAAAAQQAPIVVYAPSNDSYTIPAVPTQDHPRIVIPCGDQEVSLCQGHMSPAVSTHPTLRDRTVSADANCQSARVMQNDAGDEKGSQVLSCAGHAAVANHQDDENRPLQSSPSEVCPFMLAKISVPVNEPCICAAALGLVLHGYTCAVGNPSCESSVS
jgi:hypothetical protein